MCALLEAGGNATLDEISKGVGIERSQLAKIRRDPSYQMLVRATLMEVSNRVVEGIADLAALLNSQVRRSIGTLVEIRDNPFAKDSDRLKAATTLIDRAPAVPRIKEKQAASLILSLPVQQMQTINQALLEEGQGELVEMLKGEDFDSEQTGEGEKAVGEPEESESFEFTKVE